MKIRIFSTSPVPGAVNGTAALHQYDMDDEDERLVDEALDELAMQGHRIIDIQEERAEPERRSRRK
jgi:hypothetical protein